MARGGVEGGLHVLDLLGFGAPPIDPEVLVEPRAVEALGDPMKLRLPNLEPFRTRPGGSMTPARRLPLPSLRPWC